MSDFGYDVYGGNYPKARRLAIARSNGRCQFCGLRQAVETHHWAYPTYPPGNQVQENDLTALCKSCHELATVLRDWVGDKYANFDDLARDLEACNTFVAKREVFSYWIYPAEKEKYGYNNPEENTSTEKIWLSFLFGIALALIIITLIILEIYN